MRNYVKASIRLCGFTIVATNTPCAGLSIGMDDDDSRQLSQLQLAYMKGELPGSTFSGEYVSDPIVYYLELDREVLFRAMHVNFAAAIMFALLNRSAFQLFDYDTHLPSGPNYLDFVTDVSPKKSWSNGK